MLTISLDEFGDFEGIKKRNEPIFIAGLIYDDFGIEKEKNTERGRIEAFFRTAIKDASTKAYGFTSEFNYPSALHSNHDQIRNREVVGSVKELVNKNLSEFIQNGTYQGRPLSYINSQGNNSSYAPRKGRYYLFVILKSDVAMGKLLSPNANILARDDYASNLYFHMADELMSKLLFHNPIIEKIKDVAIDVATRSTGNLDVNSPLVQEYKRIGYKKQGGEKLGTCWFNLTNGDVYRSVIADEIIRTGKTNLLISSFNVSSISYKGETKYQEFLYLSDSICSYLSYNTSGDNANTWLIQISKHIEDLTGRDDNFIFAYDEIDLYFRKAWEAYEKGDYYEALSITFDGMRKKGTFPDFYKNNWFRRLVNSIARSIDESAFAVAAQKLHLTVQSNSFDQDKGIFIFTHIEPIAERIKDKIHTAETRKLIYQLYDTGMSVYTHIGDSTSAAACFDKCAKTANAVGFEEYLATRNRWIVSCCDNFDLETARDIAEDNVIYENYISEMKKEVQLPGLQCEDTISLGKAYSQAGQVYAFLRDKKAETYFRDALKCFLPDSANNKITQSYLLHFYLDNYKSSDYTESFSNIVADYFGGNKSLSKQLKYIVDEGTRNDPLINLKYALYVFVRSLYCYRLEEITKSISEKLFNIEKEIAKKKKTDTWELSGHPSELIFMYLSLIEIARGNNEYAEYYKSRIDSSLRFKGTTEEAICRYAKIEYANAQGKKEERDKLSQELCQFIKESYPVMKDTELPDSNDECYLWLKDRITFMYC